MGNVSVAKLGDDVDVDEELRKHQADPNYAMGKPSCSYYLLLLHFNIPPVKATALPFKYGFARLQAKIACQGTRSLDPSIFPVSTSLGITEPVEVLSIFPENSSLPIDRKDTTSYKLTVQPQWFGASGGSAEYSRAIEDSYKYKMPHVVGSASRFGDVAWTYYPAKAQAIMLGAQSTFAVVKTPYGTPSLRLLADLRYQLQTLRYVTFFPYRVCDSVDIDLRTAQGFDDLAAIQYFGLPVDARESLMKAFGTESPKHSLKYYSNEKSGAEILVDENSGAVLEIDRTTKKKIEYK